jgi:ribosomal protein L37E
MVSQDPAVTLADLLEARIDLLCRCRRCGHEAGIPVGLVAAKLGAATPIGAVAGAGILHCRACGRKDVAVRPDWGGGPEDRARPTIRGS